MMLYQLQGYVTSTSNDSIWTASWKRYERKTVVTSHTH